MASLGPLKSSTELRLYQGDVASPCQCSHPINKIDFKKIENPPENDGNQGQWRAPTLLCVGPTYVHLHVMWDPPQGERDMDVVGNPEISLVPICLDSDLENIRHEGTPFKRGLLCFNQSSPPSLFLAVPIG